MDIGFFISYYDRVVQLPVNPEKVNVKYSGNNKTSEVIKLGQINLLKDRQLGTISFESFFPEEDWFSGVRTRGDFKKPEFYKEFIETIIKDKKPCRLIITGINISMKCSIESFEYYHQAGDHEDAYYTLEFKEYRDYHITEIELNSTSKKPVSTSTSSGSSTAQPAKITKGCTVILNGTVHRDSYGAKPGKTFKNYKGKVNFINTKSSHPYHVTTLSGGWLGWVTKESVVLV